MELIQKLDIGSPALSVDWSCDPQTKELHIGFATRAGKFFHFKYGDWEPREWIEMNLPESIVQVVGNHNPSLGTFAFALGTQETGIFGVKLEKGNPKRYNFRNSWGTLAFVNLKEVNSQLLVSGSLDHDLSGFDTMTGK